MTDLANPAIEDEMVSDNPHAACGPACVASILADAGVKNPGTGQHYTVTEVNDWITAHGDNPYDGVPLPYMRDALQALGNIPSRLRNEPMATVQRTATDARHETIIWHHCTSCADPAPNGTDSHYRVGFGYRVTMNPGYHFCGRPALSNDDCTIGDMGTHLEVMVVLPKDGGDDEVLTPGFKQGMAKVVDAWVGHERGAADANFANALADDGSNLGTLINDVCQSDEANRRYKATAWLLANQAALAKLLNAVPGSVSIEQVEADIAKKLSQ